MALSACMSEGTRCTPPVIRRVPPHPSLPPQRPPFSHLTTPSRPRGLYPPQAQRVSHYIPGFILDARAKNVASAVRHSPPSASRSSPPGACRPQLSTALVPSAASHRPAIVEQGRLTAPNLSRVFRGFLVTGLQVFPNISEMRGSWSGRLSICSHGQQDATVTAANGGWVFSGFIVHVLASDTAHLQKPVVTACVAQVDGR